MRLYCSTSRDPFFHLAVENWFLRFDDECSLIFYQNAPSVVLGRFQNPWIECNLVWMRHHGIQLVRRFSGGGTVWHDEGNVNFAWIGPLKGFHKDAVLKKIQEKLADLHVEVEINQRHDLVIRHEDGSTRKVSGSAYKQTKDRALHHGTLLIRSDLTKLEMALATPHQISDTRSIASVRSKVANLSSLVPEQWVNAWGETVLLSEEDTRFDPSEFRQWQWVMGETPFFRWSFTIAGESISLSAHKGLIQELTWASRGLMFDKLAKPLRAETFWELAQGTINLQVWQEALGV